MAMGGVGLQGSQTNSGAQTGGVDDVAFEADATQSRAGDASPVVSPGTSSDDPRAIHPGIQLQLAAARTQQDGELRLRRGDSGAEIGALRRDLQALGYLTREQTSDVFGKRMERAVEAFQRDLGIRATGVAGPILRGALNDVIDRIGVGRNADSEHVVRDAQSQLYRLGYFDQRPLRSEKGEFGPRTEAAIERFQRDNDLPVTGRIGIGTFRELNRDGIDHYRQGDRAPNIPEIKRDLQAMGYLTRSDDSSLFGQRMERALRAFQRDVGIAATGVAGPTTTGNLNALAGGVGIGRTERGEAAEAIATIQSRLFRLGYFDGRPLGGEKGDFGPRTRDAVERFQRDEDLPVSGRVGPATFAALLEARRGSEFVKPVDFQLSPGSAFSYADPEGAPANNGVRYHAAKDWFAPPGTAVRAPVNGRIVEVTPSRGNSGQIYGGVVKVQAEDGKVWVFRHVDPGNVRVGQRVDAGDRLAGVTNWIGGADHVHVELWKTLQGGYDYENMIDPMRYLSRFL